MKERVQKILSQWGIASRRKAEAMILDGRVSLNGKPVSLGDRADPKIDRLAVDGRVLRRLDRPKPIYLLINKPLGVISTCSDPEGRATILDLLPPPLRQGMGLHPVGRLDADSSGALLVTNDGELTLRLTHPRYDPVKTYRVWVAGDVRPETIARWSRGVYLDGKKTRAAEVRSLERRIEKTLLEVVLQEGRNRQIRRVAEQLGHPVLALHRNAIGPVRLNTAEGKPMQKGEYRNLSVAEVEVLQQPHNTGARSPAKRQSD